ncbi:MAG: hypothetical protein SH821_16140 [Phototrophicales bacterium]|nr:hypothetical protein [Phototrophicales bacterium]
MTLQDVLRVIDKLPDEDVAQIKQHIVDRENRQKLPITANDMQQFWAQEHIQAEIQAIISQAEPVELQAGTMDVDKLMEAIVAMREGLSEAELEAIIADMNEEYIEDDAS